MTSVSRRIARLENRIWSADRPRDRFRIILRLAGTGYYHDNDACTRMLCSNGTLLEVVRFSKGNGGRDDLTGEQLDAWVEGFPIEVLAS